MWLSSWTVLQPRAPGRLIHPANKEQKEAHVHIEIEKQRALKYVSSSPFLINMSWKFAGRSCRVISIFKLDKPQLKLNVVELSKCDNLCLSVCVASLLPLSGKTDDQKVVAFLPVAYMYQMFPEQQRGTKKGRR